MEGAGREREVPLEELPEALRSVKQEYANGGGAFGPRFARARIEVSEADFVGLENGPLPPLLGPLRGLWEPL